MKRIVVLGAGRVGTTIARDLARDVDLEVVAMDRRGETLHALEKVGIATRQLDVTDTAALAQAVQGADAAVNAVPGFLGYGTLKALIEHAIPVVDIAFMPEDFASLHDLAISRRTTAVVDFGVAPGLSNLLVGRSAAKLESIESVDIVVGGLPLRRVKPWEYTAPFSPVDVLEEYTRTARLVEYGEVVDKPALTDLELLELPEVGTLEAFNTDGLRTLLDNIDARFMRERTLRYPGYAEKIMLLRDTGFLSTDPVTVNGLPVRPMDLTSKLLFKAWRLPPGEPELTVMRVEVTGMRDGRSSRFVYDLYDEYDVESGTSSMARTTGFPAAIMARMVARGEFVNPGINAPENVGRDKAIYDHILSELRSRNVEIRERVTSQ